MRLGVEILNSGATLNNFKTERNLVVGKGDTAKLVFRLVDLETGCRYVPSQDAEVLVTISRYPEYFPTVSGSRETRDYTIQDNASNPFADDRSIWQLPLTAEQTQTITSSAVRFTLTENAGADVKNCVVPYAISAFNDGEQ